MLLCGTDQFMREHGEPLLREPKLRPFNAFLKDKQKINMREFWQMVFVQQGSTAAQFSLMLLLSTIVTSAAHAEESFAPVYSAQGIFTFTQRVGQRVAKPRSWNFDVARDKKGRWRIGLLADVDMNGMTIHSSSSVVYDGTNIYNLTSGDVVEANPANPSQITKLPNPGIQVASISTGPYPIDGSSALGILWLAYIAGDQLDSNTNRSKFPNLTVTDARTDPMAWSCDLVYEISQSDESNKLLKHGRFIVNPQYIKERFAEYPELDEPGNGATENRQLFYKYNFMKTNMKSETIAATYVLQKTQVVNGVTIPTMFHVEIPTEALGIGTNGYSHFDGQVTNFTSVSVNKLLPDLCDSVTVRDRRLRVKTMGSPVYRQLVEYQVTDRAWPTDTNDARVQAAVDTHAGWQRVYLGRQVVIQRNPQFVKLIILFILAMPIAFFTCRKIFRRNE